MNCFCFLFAIDKSRDQTYGKRGENRMVTNFAIPPFCVLRMHDVET